MGEATVVLKVKAPDGAKTYECNGIPEERAVVRDVFEELMRSRQYFAYVTTTEGNAQVRTFDDVEAYEKQVGTVAVTLQPALQGG